jgi:uncharacterized protein with GYD domain
MPTYIMLGRLTAQAKKNPAASIKARDDLFREFGKQGVKVTAYMTLGPYDVVNVVEAPSEEVMMKFLVTAGAHGNLDSVTLRAFTQSESDRIRGA